MPKPPNKVFVIRRRTMVVHRIRVSAPDAASALIAAQIDSSCAVTGKHVMVNKHPNTASVTTAEKWEVVDGLLPVADLGAPAQSSAPA